MLLRIINLLYFLIIFINFDFRASKLKATFCSAQQTLEGNLPALWEELFGANEAIIQERLDSIEGKIHILYCTYNNVCTMYILYNTVET